MKIFFLMLCLIFSLSTIAATETPRQTMQTFLKAMVKIKNQEGNQKENYKNAISTLNIKETDKSLKQDIGKRYAEQLIKTIDKIKRVDYQKIPNSDNGQSTWIFDQRSFKKIPLEISITKYDKEWLFSSATLDSLIYYEELFKDKKNIAGVVGLTTITDRFKDSLPPSFLNKAFWLYNWQWFALLLIAFFAFIIHKIFDFSLAFTLNKYFAIVQKNSNKQLLKAIHPLGRVLFFLILLQAIPHLEFSASSLALTKRILYITMSIFAVMFGHRMIDLISFYATQKAQETETKFDDILVPLLSKTAYVILYIVGALLIAKSLTIDVSGIIAGLGIGGLAFAFAAKDTLANFFGSIMLVLDRPFDIGDVVISGGIEGTVELVGFRSTRIRTFNDTLITISNGELMNRSIENLGKRRFRRLVTSLGLEYDTPPEKIEAFCEGVRQLIVNHPWTRKDSFHVYFTNFGASSLDIQVICYWKTEDYARELAEKHRLMIDILRLAETVGVSFAFPTQTLHMFQEEHSKLENINGEFREVGRAKAKEITAKPMTLKNPRSNSEDTDQFGNNEV